MLSYDSENYFFVMVIFLWTNRSFMVCPRIAGERTTVTPRRKKMKKIFLKICILKSNGTYISLIWISSYVHMMCDNIIRASMRLCSLDHVFILHIFDNIEKLMVYIVLTHLLHSTHQILLPLYPFHPKLWHLIS